MIVTARGAARAPGRIRGGPVLVGEYCRRFAAELSRYCSAHTQWTAELFTCSTPGLLSELLAVGHHRATGALSDESLDQLRAHVQHQVLADPGLGDRRRRGEIVAALPKPAKSSRSGVASRFGPASYSSVALRSRVDAVHADYLGNWCDELAGPRYSEYRPGPSFAGPSPARAAALIAAFLIEQGVSRTYLSKWVAYRAAHTPQEFGLHEFVLDVSRLHTKGRGTAEVLAVLAAQPPETLLGNGEWLSAAEARQWLAANGSTGPSTVHGGLLFTSAQWDIYAALDHAGRALDRLRSRVNLSLGRTVRFHRQVWIKGIAAPRALPGPVELRTLLPAYEVGSTSTDTSDSADRLEVAVDFLHSANVTGGPSAAGSLWAALESLFVAPGDEQRGVAVVGRAVDVAVVAHIRHQVQSTIGYLRSRTPEEPIARELDALPEPERIAHLERRVAGGLPPSAHIRAAVELDRVAGLLTPDGIGSVRAELQHALFGLYRQRNLILHGGVTDAPMLGPTLRDGLPLVAAVINRYARRIRTAGAPFDPLLLAYQDTLLVTEAVERPVGITRFFDG